MSFVIRGLGTAVPNTVIEKEEGPKVAFSIAGAKKEQLAWLPNMYTGTGINTRHIFYDRAVIDDILNDTNETNNEFLPKKDDPGHKGPTTGRRMQFYKEEVPAIAQKACRAAIDQAGVSLNRFSHLITVSCTGFYAPGLDTQIIRDLNLPANISRTHVGFMGCHGALNGLRVAKAYTDAHPDAQVLLCAAELCSVHYHYGWDAQKVVANALFADGSAAIVGTSAEQSTGTGWKLLRSGAHIFPDSADAMSWTIGDNGFGMTLSKKVPELIRTSLRPWLSQWLAEHKMTIADVGSWAIHPGGPKILDGVEEALNFSKDVTAVSREILSDFGNMSSPTLLFTIQRMMEYGAELPCVALGFGPGLAVEAALFG